MKCSEIKHNQDTKEIEPACLAEAVVVYKGMSFCWAHYIAFLKWESNKL